VLMTEGSLKGFFKTPIGYNRACGLQRRRRGRYTRAKLLKVFYDR